MFVGTSALAVLLLLWCLDVFECGHVLHCTARSSQGPPLPPQPPPPLLLSTESYYYLLCKIRLRSVRCVCGEWLVISDVTTSSVIITDHRGNTQ